MIPFFVLEKLNVRMNWIVLSELLDVSHFCCERAVIEIIMKLTSFVGNWKKGAMLD